MTRRKLTSGSVVEQIARFSTAPIQPTAGSVVLVFIANTRPAFSGGSPATPTITSAGMSWQLVETVTVGVEDDRRLTCFRSMTDTAPGADAVVIDFGGQTQNYCVWSVFEYDGVETGGQFGSAAVIRSGSFVGSDAGLSESLAAPGDPDGAISVGAVMLELVNEAPRPVAPGVGCSEIDELGASQLPFGRSTTLQTQDAAGLAGPMAWTWPGTARAAAILVVLKPSPVGSPPDDGEIETLIRRFEPVLTFDATEAFFPVDAKRYAENAGLWPAISPFRDKTLWGVSDGAGGRSPLVGPMGLDLAPGGSRPYIGNPALAPTDGELALELGGWKDQNDAHESGVTSSTTNRYADRAEITRRYASDLEPSKFWYHAEFFDKTRLLTLASGTAATVPLAKTINALGIPSLLCYYFFFPAHEQSVGDGGCPNVEAKEVACHAGDWQCVALLLDDDGSGTAAGFTPRFVGYTGLRPSGDQPLSFDAEYRTVIKVAEWFPDGDSAVQPAAVGDHPKFFVAKGSHSIYTSPGRQDVSPYQDGQAPQKCGRIDSAPFPLFVGMFNRELEKDLLVFLAKLALGGAVGGLLGGFSAGLLEADNNADPLPVPDPDDSSDPDQTAETGIVVRPAGLAIPGMDPAATLVDWRSAKVAIDGRDYDFVVNRSKQGFWPNDDGVNGYRGRWGQRVTHDDAARRSGPTLPAYWAMFLSALEGGKNAKKLTF